LTSIIQNQKGITIVSQELDFNKLGSDYFTEVVRDEIRQG